MYGLHFLIQETQGFLHKFRFKADLKDAVRKKAAGEPGGNPGRSRRCNSELIQIYATGLISGKA